MEDKVIADVSSSYAESQRYSCLQARYKELMEKEEKDEQNV